ncbi:MAG: family transcriptional regulator [Paenibacillaceae bacterium]|nr:family transcriptional regulator [Paenibacillaceae bacterium]
MMNKAHIGQTILFLRKGRGITQEQLAAMVGVSAGAVSKWENGNSAPDIALLAPLARALHTSLDILLSFQREPSEAEAGRIKRELADLFIHQGYEAGEARGRAYLEEYPTSFRLKYIVAALNEMYLMMSELDSPAFIEEKRRESLALFRQVADSGDGDYRHAALFSLAHTQMVLENYQASEDALKELPQAFFDPMTLYPTLLMRQGKHKEAANLCAKKLLHDLTQANLMLIVMANSAMAEETEQTGNPEETTEATEAVKAIEAAEGGQPFARAALYLNTAHQLEEMFSIGLGSAAYNLSRLHLKAGRLEEAADWFAVYADRLLAAGYDHEGSPYFGDIRLEVDPEGQKVLRKKLFQTLPREEEFQPLKGFPAYGQALEKLNAAAAAL